MPTYTYDCQSCGGFDFLRAMAERNEPAACPDCGSVSTRVLTAAPQLALVSSGTRIAEATNERARHQPKSSGEYVRLKHAPGCSCCSTGKSKSTVVAPDGAKTFPSKRPWMISH
ncbi:MAG: zinc ribbon domain-containing protein [Burkholderiales bacterium]|nr:MAG: zinc ribbon domain-containing protein [Betaproteobacteria bacterium]TAG24283.1 MAG: zinc ribbon domain-containing protein [Burkholderiales bacterium]